MAFAKKADDEGLPQVAKLFRAAADAETVHAHAHLRVLGGIKNTQDNLQEAIEGEGQAKMELYISYKTVTDFLEYIKFMAPIFTLKLRGFSRDRSP